MKKYKLQNIVSITQILSSFAVLISIIYLITEYNRSGLMNEKSIENLVYGRFMRLDELIIENPDMAEIILKASNNPDSLTKKEVFRYAAYEHIFYDSWETLWVGHRDGLVGDKTWKDWDDWFKVKAKAKPVLALKENEHDLDPEFLNYIYDYMEIH